MKTTQKVSLRSPKHKYMAGITFAMYVEGVGQAVSVTGNSIQDVKKMALEYRRFNPHVVIRENRAQYPKFDWVIVEEYTLKKDRNMKTYSNLFGCSTYFVSDSENNRFNFHGLVECDDELIETLKGGTEVELKDVNPRILETFKDNDVNLNDYTHCIVVDNEYYLSWE